eukprot:8927664-Ditylum_brightwellii.AAC.1
MCQHIQVKKKSITPPSIIPVIKEGCTSDTAICFDSSDDKVPVNPLPSVVLSAGMESLVQTMVPMIEA